MPQPYDPVGAMGGLFAPSYIHGNPESEAAVQKWQAENHAVTPAMIEASRGPSSTVTNPAVGGLGIRGRGDTTTTVQGSVDPEALRIYAQGGKYTPAPPATLPPPVASGGTGAVGAGAGTGGIRDTIAQTLMAQYPGMTLTANPNPDQASPLRYLMGGGDPSSFMQGSFSGGA